MLFFPAIGYGATRRQHQMLGGLGLAWSALNKIFGPVAQPAILLEIRSITTAKQSQPCEVRMQGMPVT
jgi:hypothetical protein